MKKWLLSVIAVFFLVAGVAQTASAQSVAQAAEPTAVASVSEETSAKSSSWEMLTPLEKALWLIGYWREEYFRRDAEFRTLARWYMRDGGAARFKSLGYDRFIEELNRESREYYEKEKRKRASDVSLGSASEAH
ncbi:MAG: hypothetical protein IJO06_05610 [Thermoguttaceae bacterium]|nr:hypothetical protein [Thermoguttaceae bacterium]